MNTIFFDLDNTLFDRDSAFRRYVKDFVERHSYAFEGNTSFEEIINIDCRGLKDRELFCKEVLNRFPKLRLSVEDLWEDHRSLPDFAIPDERVIDLLTELSNEFTLALLSNGSSNMQRRKLENLKIAHLFDHLFISGEMGMNKPHFELFHGVLQIAGGDINIMVGDDYEKDIFPASQLSFKTVYITDDVLVKGNADVAIFEIYDVKEVLQWLI